MRSAIQWALGAVVVCITPAAFAQEVVTPDRAEPQAPEGTILAPKNALELQFNAGYTQPFGHLGGTTQMSDVASAGFQGAGALVWRLTPWWGVAGYGGFHQSAVGDSLDGGMVFGGAGGVAANFHFNPYRLVDPYLVAGAGYRLLFLAPGTTADNHMMHGFEVLKTDFGVDFRTSKNFALGPMIGATVDAFAWDYNETQSDNNVIRQRGVSTFIFAGISGKMDVLGARVPEHPVKTAFPEAYPPGVPVPAAGPPEPRPTQPEALPPGIDRPKPSLKVPPDDDQDGEIYRAPQ